VLFAPRINGRAGGVLRESYRVGGKVKKRTLLQPQQLVAPPQSKDVRTRLKGATAVPPGLDAIIIKRSLPRGHAAVLGTLRRSGLDRLLGPVGHAANRSPSQLDSASSCQLVLSRAHDGRSASQDVPCVRLSAQRERYGKDRSRKHITEVRASAWVNP
jgi:hypothetical protein